MSKYVVPVGRWVGANISKAGFITLGVVAAAMGDSPIYRVRGGEIIDSRHARLAADPTGRASLSLVTCYPFDTIRPGGPLRYVVFAEGIAGS